MGSYDGRGRALTDDNARTTPSSIYTSSHTLVVDIAPAGMGEPSIPLSIFSTRLSGLQAIVRYLHETGRLSFTEIARALGRSPKTIWTTYSSAKDGDFSFEEGGLSVPVSRFASRELSVLETLVVYLAALGFSNAETARMLALDPRTTHTVRRRAERKGVRLA